MSIPVASMKVMIVSMMLHTSITLDSMCVCRLWWLRMWMITSLNASWTGMGMLFQVSGWMFDRFCFGLVAFSFIYL